MNRPTKPHTLVAVIGNGFDLDLGLGTRYSDLTKTTNFLVVGEQNLSVVGPDGMSSKQRKAKEYNEQGLDIELLTEDDFIEAMHLEGVVANDQVN